MFKKIYKYLLIFWIIFLSINNISYWNIVQDKDWNNYDDTKRVFQWTYNVLFNWKKMENSKLYISNYNLNFWSINLDQYKVYKSNYNIWVLWSNSVFWDNKISQISFVLEINWKQLWLNNIYKSNYQINLDCSWDPDNSKCSEITWINELKSNDTIDLINGTNNFLFNESFTIPNWWVYWPWF